VLERTAGPLADASTLDFCCASFHAVLTGQRAFDDRRGEVGRVALTVASCATWLNG
jgi:hypothetical protein